MSPLSILLLALAMSTDAFAAAVGKGAAMQRPRLRYALRVGLIFGAIEGLMPLAGWALGAVAARYVTQWDHWIAFALLAGLGLRMIWLGARNHTLVSDQPRPHHERHGFWALAATGFATSIDAMAVGVGLAFLDVNIVLVATVVGVTTLLMVTAGILLGRVFGAFAGKRAEIVGGMVLIAIGTTILVQHLELV